MQGIGAGQETQGFKVIAEPPSGVRRAVRRGRESGFT